MRFEPIWRLTADGAIFDGASAPALPQELSMRRIGILLAVVGLTVSATVSLSAQPLPDKPTLMDFVAFIQRAAGVAIEAVEDSGSYVGAIGNIGSISFFEDASEDQDINEIVQQVLRGKSRGCTAFRPTGLTREDFGDRALVRVAVRCLHAGVELHGEEIIVADPMRYQNFSMGGPMENREKIAAIANGVFTALVNARR
jgi:hypothetical protein